MARKKRQALHVTDRQYGDRNPRMKFRNFESGLEKPDTIGMHGDEHNGNLLGSDDSKTNLKDERCYRLATRG